jgi:hypothetical protein
MCVRAVAVLWCCCCCWLLISCSQQRSIAPYSDVGLFAAQPALPLAATYYPLFYVEMQLHAQQAISCCCVPHCCDVCLLQLPVRDELTVGFALLDVAHGTMRDSLLVLRARDVA